MGHHRALAALLVVSLAVGCTPQSLAAVVAEHRLANDSLVRLDDDLAIAASIASDGQVQVLYFKGGAHGWSAKVLASANAGEPSEGSAHLFGFGGDSAEVWNTFFYGTAPIQTSRVSVEGFDYEGGQVSNGAWVIALREKDLSPDQLRWVFTTAGGGTVASGTGIFPAGG